MRGGRGKAVVSGLAILLALAGCGGDDDGAVATAEGVGTGDGAFTPPSEDSIPDGPYGDMVRHGRDLFVNTQSLKDTYVGNDLSCGNCHLGAGRLVDSAPLWAAFPMFPAYRGKNDTVNTMADRIQGCFRYSMDGTPPPADSEVMTALLTYMGWMARGAPIGETLPGRGYPELDEPARSPDPERGAEVYAAKCAVCHGDDGQGRRAADGTVVFPPLWGSGSFNWGAGMHRVNTAAGFIQANMPFSQPGTVTDQEAWDVATFMNGHDRPEDPRFTGSVARTDSLYHDHMCRYGER